MTREITFVLACLRGSIQPGSPLPDASGLDWNAVLELAGKHAITPLLYQSIHDACAGAVPGPVLDELREQCRDNARFNLTLSAELSRLLTLLDREGIAAIPLKGPMLSAVLYGNMALRVSSDLDILIRPQDVLPVRDLLLANGYLLGSTLHWPSDSACFRARESQISFSGSSNSVSVDVHWRSMPGYHPDAFDNERIWRSLRLIPLAGSTARMLSSEHLLLFLCAHGAKHLWERLGWICDVSRLLQTERRMDWSEVFLEAERTHTLRILCLGLALAQDLFGIDLAPAASERLAVDRRARSLAQTVRRRLFANAPIPAPAMESALFELRTFERNSDRLRYIAGVFLRPSEAEYRALRLPPALYFLYYPFRPLRLIWKYSARALRFNAKHTPVVVAGLGTREHPPLD